MRKKPARGVCDLDTRVATITQHDLRIPVQPAHKRFLGELKSQQLIVATNTWAVRSVSTFAGWMHSSEGQTPLEGR